MTIAKLAPWAVLILAACSAGIDTENAEAQAEPAAAPAPERVDDTKPGAVSESALDRIAAIQRAVTGWRNAGDLAAAKRHAEAARNLIVGPRGPGYGDADGDGVVAGSTEIGLLSGLDGGSALAIPPANECVTRDLLGGSWGDPGKRWAILQQKIDAWRPERNTFPTLPSHAQRVVGWATLTLNSNDVATARDFAGHAQIHVDVSRRAMESC